VTAFDHAWTLLKQRGFEPVVTGEDRKAQQIERLLDRLEGVQTGIDLGYGDDYLFNEQRQLLGKLRELGRTGGLTAPDDPMLLEQKRQQAADIEAEGIDLPDVPSSAPPANIGQAGSSGVLPPAVTMSVPKFGELPQGAGLSTHGQQDYPPDFMTFSEMAGFDDGEHFYPDMYEPTLNRRFNRLDVGRFPNRKTQEQMYVPESYTGEPLYPSGQEPPVNMPIAPQRLAIRLNNPFDPNEVALMRQTLANQQTPLGQALARVRAGSGPQPLQFDQ
jgi:hypothetical protein